MNRTYPVFTVTEKAERSIRSGHPWVYGEEIISAASAYDGGDIVDVMSRKGKWLGAGYVNDTSKIRVRIISRNTNDIFDDEFYRRRISYAISYRRQLMGGSFNDSDAACRLIFGEADLFPGLTVDRFGDILVTEVLSLGIDKIKSKLYKMITDELAALGCKISAVYERSDSPIRIKEGLTSYSGFMYGTGDGHTVIKENGIFYDVDYIGGQKTGFFLDQRDNRAAAARIASGLHVLDCFTHTGAFALNCAAAGAASVTAVDISADAISEAERNAALNGMSDRINFIKADVFELLTDMLNRKCRDYDYIILDPPAFTKSSATVNSAYRGYKDINMRAMRLLPRGGYLATCSCSHFMTDELFRRMLSEAAADASVSLRQIEVRRQAPDHPILWGVPETEYLKFYIFQVV